MPVKFTVRGPALGEVVRLLIGSRVGRSFTGLIVRPKSLLALPPFPSVTVIVTCVTPNWLVKGVMTAVRLVPLPLNTILVLRSRVAFDDVAARVRLPAGVSASPTVNEI